MKTKCIIILAAIAVVLSSCELTNNYYQLYKVVPSDNITIESKYLVYEDDNCQVYYDLWQEQGNIGFRFYNKTDKNIYVNLEECFFILNGIAYNYYRNRVFSNSLSTGVTTTQGASASKSVTGLNYLNLIQTNSVSAGSSAGTMISSGSSVSQIEEKTICIPSFTSKKINEYSINGTLLRDCDLFVYPNKREIKTLTFEKSESPLKFSNRIVYTVGQSNNPIKFENEFYVSEITNYPESEFGEYRFDKNCEETNLSQSMYFKESPPYKFYLKYTSGQISWKH